MNEYRDEAQDRDWERISELLRGTDCVPEAPDCRAAVMARIAKPKPVLRYGWAFGTAFAALVVAAIGIAPFLTHPRQVDRIAHSPKPGISTPAPEVAPPLFAEAPALPAEPREHSVKAPRVSHKKSVMMASAGDATPETRPQMGPKGEKAENKDQAALYYKGSNSGLAETKTRAPVAVTSLQWHYVLAGSDSKSDYSKDVNADVGVTEHAPAGEVDRVANAAETMDDKQESVSAYYDSPVRADRPARKVETFGGARLRDSKPAKASTEMMAAAPVPPAAGSFDAGDGVLTGRPVLDAPTGGSSTLTMPLAIAMVTWPSNSQPKDSYDYNYTKRDPKTGSTTECRVKRTGNSVEIYLESKPAAPEPPVKGSLEHDTTPNA